MSEEMTIVTLKGADRVRKRPVVIFGEEGLLGALNAIKYLLNIFVDEAAKSSSKIEVTLRDDKSIAVRSFDRGFWLDETIVDGKPAWQTLLGELYAFPRNEDEFIFALTSKDNSLYGKSEPFAKYPTDSMQAYDFCCVQYASRFMQVESTIDGEKKTVRFEMGKALPELKKETTKEQNNTFVHFKLDEDVFGAIEIKSEDITKMLREFAITCRGLKCVFVDQNTGESETFEYTDGIADYARELAEYNFIYFKELEANGKDRYNKKEYDARVRVALGFAECDGMVCCLHNYKLIDGGSHLKAAQKMIEKQMSWHLFDWENVTFEKLKNKLVLLIESNCSFGATRYETARQMSIDNRMIADMVCDLFGDDFAYFLEQNKEKILGVIG